jgi:hypothetical protein
LEEIHAKLTLQLANLRGERRLRNRQRLRGAGEAEVPGDGQEVAKLRKFYIASLLILFAPHYCTTK